MTADRGSGSEAEHDELPASQPAHVEIGVEEVVHKVASPPRQSTLKKLRARAKETFFPDDPLRRFKGRPAVAKWILAAQYLFPILTWAPNYSLSLFKSDIIAGLTIASLAIPQGISFAQLAYLPPILGLYSSFVPPLLYSVLGSSRDLAAGPGAITSLLMGSMLRQVVNPSTNPALFLQLALTTTLVAGIFQASLGILRLGFIVDFMSKATLIGFMAGAALIITLQQLKSLLGIVHFTKQMGLVPVLSSVFHNRDEWTWQTVVLGICFLLFLLLTRHISIRRPKLFWVSAGAPLASVIISTLLVFLFKAQNHGIKTVGHLQRGLNHPSWHQLLLDGSYLGTVVKTGIITGIISLIQAIAVGRTFAAVRDYQIDGNKEMMAIGVMNIVGSCTSCFVTTVLPSTITANAGCKTAMSNIVMAMTVMVTLLVLMPLFAYTPNVVLGAIIITAVVGLIDIPMAYHLWKMDKMDFLVCLSAFLGVIFISVQDGLSIAVGLSMFRILLQTMRPKMVILGNIPGTDVYRNLHHYKNATRVDGFIILGIESSINFVNTTYLNERITRWIEDEKVDGDKQTALQFVLLDLSAVSAVDTSGVSFLIDLKKSMEKRGLELVFINPVGEVMEKLQRANNINNFLEEDSLYLTIGEAIFSFSSSAKGVNIK